MDRENDPGWQYVRLNRDDLAKDQTRPFNAKTATWVPDPEEGFIFAEIKSTKGDMVTVLTEKGEEKTLKKDLLQEMNPPKFSKTEDMSNLSFLNDAAVLWNLRDRYASMLIYTYSGLFCVVVNPYKRLPIYTDSMARIFMGKRRNEVPPHLWAVSDEAYRNMQQDRQNQSMLITGESGAGKTENTKKVIAYFAALGQVMAEQAGIVVDKSKKKVTLEDQIVQTNPVLEAFGNAKTVRNNNSSRFGKFIRIHFNRQGRVASCDIDHYLLEKSRVVRQAPGERCYHIFYQMCSGYDPALMAKLQLDKHVREYWYVNQAEITINGVDDKEEFQLTDEAFDILMFSPEEKFDVYRICSGLMHQGEMKFKQRPREEQADPDGDDEAKKCASMFGVDPDPLLNAYCKPRVRVGTEWVNKGQNVEQVNWAKGAMTKGIYNRLFNWLVSMCNKTLDQKELERVNWCGVLDIAGFEIFDFNSFEQIWINFVNEKLQQFFNHHMFVLEQEEYKREGIDWVFIDFGLDLAACIELIEKPMGIISMLDEECVVPKGTDLSYAGKLADQHLGKHPNFMKPAPPKGKQAEAHFALKHYAGLVRYNVSNWLEKNKDPLNDTVITCMKASTGNKLSALLWDDFQTQEEAMAAQKKGTESKGGKKKGKSASMTTVSMGYRESLNNLMTMLHATHPHFIRCLIPNELKKSGLLDATLVMNQLTCNGVLEGIRICRKGFPNRTVHPDMKQRYALLAANEARSSDDPKTAVTAMMKRIVDEKYLNAEEFRVGHTKVFFKAGILAKLEDVRDDVMAKLMLALQALCRWYHANHDAGVRKKQLSGYTVLQGVIRQWATVRDWPWFKLLADVKREKMGAAREAEERRKREEEERLKNEAEKAEKARRAIEEEKQRIIAEKQAMINQLANAANNLKDAEANIAKLEGHKREMERQVQDLNERVQEQEDRTNEMAKGKRAAEKECEDLKRNVSDLEMSIRKAEAEKQSKDHQLRSLQDEMTAQDANMNRLSKEKKQQEEVNRKLTEDLQAEEDKVNHMNKIKAKLEQSLDDLEGEIEREKRSRQDLEKSKRKIEGDLKVASEQIDELNKIKAEMEAKMKAKEAETVAMAQRLEDEQSIVAKTQRHAKDLQVRVTELEEQLENEKQHRARAERAKGDMQRELEEMNDRVLAAGSATEAAVEANRRREADMAKIRRDLDEANMNHENSLASLRKKHNDAVAEMGDQLEQLNKAKAKSEKDRAALQRQFEEAQAAADQESKARGNYERMCKQLEIQVADLQAKGDDQSRQLQDGAHQRTRLQNDLSESNRHLEEAESQIHALQRLKSQLATSLEEAKRQADTEGRERQSLLGQCRGFQHELDQLREQLDREADSKSDLMRQLSKANAEVAEWRSRFESEGLMKAEELEEHRRKLQARLADMQDQLDVAHQKVASVDKLRQKMAGELDDAHMAAERANTLASSLEKRQKGFDRVIDEWRMKCDALANELDAAQRDGRNLATDVFKLRSQNDELHEQIDSMRRENKTLAQEVKDLADQLSDGGRSVHELQKVARRLELEKEELQSALDEAEATLESQESKVHRAQVEVAQIRQEIEKRIHEKEEEFESTRKNHQRAIDSMQASLETEARGRAELLRLKKKLEADLNELEIGLDHANKANMDAQKNLRIAQDHIKDLQLQLEDEIRIKNEERDRYITAERRAQLLQSEKDELMTNLDQAQRARKQAEAEAQDAIHTANDLSSQNAQLSSHTRRLEAELHGIHSELEEALAELRASDENCKKAMSDAARLAEELRQEQEHSAHLERGRKSLDNQLRDMQNRLDEAESAALKGGKKVIAKLETRIRELETEIDSETRRHSEAQKNIAKQERRIRELQFQVDEDVKNQSRLNDLIGKLQEKFKVSKRQVEEAEELATVNLQKYRQLQHQLEDAEERADLAENSLAKIRGRSRAGPYGLSTSRSQGSMLRSASVHRGPGQSSDSQQ